MVESSFQENSMDITRIAQFMGTVSAHLENGNKIMETLSKGQESLQHEVASIRSDIAVMQSATEIKRVRCNETMTEHAKRIIELEDRTRRDKILINDLEKRLEIDHAHGSAKKELLGEQLAGSKEKREVTVYQMGLVLFLIQLLSFLFVHFWK